MIIIALAAYAVKLIIQLKQQQKQKQALRQQRLSALTESIQTIAKAMEQQQCNYSEGAIRICRLLESVPLSPLPDYSAQFPALYELELKVRQFDTHEDRKLLSRQERQRQDMMREEFEAHLSQPIDRELRTLKAIRLTG